MTKGVVTCNLYKRKGKASVNAEKLGFFVSGDEVEILDVELGETENDYYEGTPTWYKLTNGIYVWSGGVSLNLEEEVFKRKLELDRKASEKNVVPSSAVLFNLAEKLAKNIDLPEPTHGDMCIAVLDSGIDQRYSTLQQRIVFTKNFQNDVELNEHGTAVAGIMVGDGSFQKGLYPEAKLLDLRVLEKNKVTNDYAVFEALNFVIDWNSKKNEPKVNVINLSLDVKNNTIDYLRAPVRTLSDSGVVIVVAGTKYGWYSTELSKLEKVIKVGTFESDSIQKIPKDLTLIFRNDSIVTAGLFPDKIEFGDSSCYTALTSALVARYLSSRPEAGFDDVLRYLQQISSHLPDPAEIVSFKPYMV